jgi:uncharacterized membrane protein affecting hemolysin expression
MRWNDLFFNVDFGKSIQNGIDEFARLSGYKIHEKRQVQKNKIPTSKGTRHSLLLRFLIIVLLTMLLLIGK